MMPDFISWSLISWIFFVPQQIQERIVLFAAAAVICVCAVYVSLSKREKAVIRASDWPLWLFCSSMWSLPVIAVCAFCGFYAGRTGALSSGRMDSISRVFCFCSFAAGAASFLELYFGRNFIYENIVSNNFYIRYSKHFPRPMAAFGNPVIAGTFFMSSLPFGIYLAVYGKGFFRYMGRCCVLLSSCMVLLSASRGVLLGLAGSVSFYFILIRRPRWILYVLLSLILISSLGTYLPYRNLKQFSYSKFAGGSQDSIISKYRTDRVKMALTIAKEKPFLGIGLGNFRKMFYRYSGTPEGELTPYELMITDNMYLSLLAETGAAGLISFFIFIYFLFKKVFVGYLKGVESAPGTAIVFSSIAGLLVNMAAYDMFFWYSPLILFFFLCGFSWRREYA